MEYCDRHISKTKGDKAIKFCTDYQVSVQISIPGFSVNWKIKNEVLRAGNGTGSANLKNDSNNILQIWYIIFYLYTR